MSKELEEIKCIVAVHFGALGFLNPIENEQILKDRDKVLNALTELQSIKEASPSEAMECLDRCYDQLVSESDNELEFKTIKHYILKAQEQKQYLKWEDLEFKPYTMKVKMGDNLYMLDWRYSNDDDYDNSKSVTLRTLNGDWLSTLERYFFNDLHLEVVE